MWIGQMRCGWLCLCVTLQPLTTRAAQDFVQPVESKTLSMVAAFPATWPVTFAQAISPAGQPADADLQLGPTESRTQHAARVNRMLTLVTSLILGAFVLCRIFLLRQISHNRRKLVQATINPPETKA
jgi:hypothetical protein